jgi:hypothetical protein
MCPEWQEEIESIARPLASLAAIARVVVAGEMVEVMESCEALTVKERLGAKAFAPIAKHAITAP